MSVLFVLILVSLGVASLFLAAFLWAVRNNQFEDTYTPSVRILTEENQVQEEGQSKREKG